MAAQNSTPPRSPGKHVGHGEFLRKWEASAQISQKQQDICNEIEGLLADGSFQCTPYAHFRRMSSSSGTPKSQFLKSTKRKAQKVSQGVAGNGKREEKAAFGDELEALQNVKTTEDFRSWYEEIERRLDDANEQKYHSLIEGLRAGNSSCVQLRNTLQTCVENLAAVKQSRDNVIETTSKFKSACENVVSERKRHVELADVLRCRLTYFEELETLSVKFGSGKDSVYPTNPEFLQQLHRLDECIVYASSSTGAVAEADGYLARFLELQRRAFTMMRDYCRTELKLVTQQVLKDLKNDGNGHLDGNFSDASKEFLKFRTIAPKVKVLMDELYMRSKEKKSSFAKGMKSPSSSSTVATNPLFSTRNYAINLLGDCEECYIEQRKKILEPRVAHHIKKLASTKKVVDFTRLASSYVLHLCQVEGSLYEHFFFIEEDKESFALSALLQSFCSIFYEELRSHVLQELDLDTLVYLIEILRTEMIGSESAGQTIGSKAFMTAATRCIADAQERIIYRAEVYMRDEIRNFQPSAQNLDYPEKLLEKSGADSAKQGRPNSSSVYATWYPPVEKTLRLLSMLYRCVDGQVFAGIAQESVAICVKSLTFASSRIQSSGKAKAEDHADLFLIWQLLMLREQTSPFDVDFSYIDKELNFDELRGLLGGVIRGQTSIRSLATPPAAMKNKVVDSKRELDRGVVTACEGYVLRTTRYFLDPILSFLAKCNALPAMSNTPLRHPPSPSTTAIDRKTFESLKNTENSYLHPGTVKNMWETVETKIRDEFPAVVQSMKLYINKSSSCAILLRPVRANFSEAFSELLSALQTRYTLEEREVIDINGEKVENLLAAMDEIMDIPEIESEKLRSKAKDPRQPPGREKDES
mmetsp:Transcript_168/g.525  ORF Transcript_168/g.525 Transcript_168/m.525 type:complete len:870 (+) Transcript_168:258-2867(+)|eukprot:CAMPEP_0198731248 /NCGR_PEP_ID=MMETSP1475-20131203/28925_1 /TAXON_ID= ORGANISM="Unidentified sp., Strain CCMP1999" /NCGR_SAMPLE_ID=MMETSP1475 /ASSEMBLY_ACC=CAM_ASM_001111 /LENGTH=869 /DNA_ID=CAMNT_0044494191 /DNA_START=202 /DNA_END=2811 /DNA_ORIENTATION=-